MPIDDALLDMTKEEFEVVQANTYTKEQIKKTMENLKHSANKYLAVVDSTRTEYMKKVEEAMKPLVSLTNAVCDKIEWLTKYTSEVMEPFEVTYPRHGFKIALLHWNLGVSIFGKTYPFFSSPVVLDKQRAYKEESLSASSNSHKFIISRNGYDELDSYIWNIEKKCYAYDVDRNFKNKLVRAPRDKLLQIVRKYEKWCDDLLLLEEHVKKQWGVKLAKTDISLKEFLTIKEDYVNAALMETVEEAKNELSF